MTASSQSCILQRDSRTSIPRAGATGANILWSSGSAWRNVIAQAHRFENGATTELKIADHSIVLHLSVPVFVELKTEDQCDSRRRRPGDLSVLPAETVCQVRSDEAHEILLVSVSQKSAARSESDLRYAGRMKPNLYLRDAQIEYICRALKAEAESNCLAGPLYGDSLAMALSAHLASRYSSNDPSANYRGGMSPHALRRVIEHIECNLEDTLRVASLAEVAGLSQFRFAHNFRSAIGLPPHQYVLRTRLERAKRMLRETKMPILEIAYSVGCQSSSRFHSLFRRETGTNPSAYRALFQ